MNLVQRKGIEHAAGANFTISRQKRGRILNELGLIFYLHGGTEIRGIKTDVTEEINGRIEHDHLDPLKGPGLGIELDKEMVNRYAAQVINKIVIEN